MRNNSNNNCSSTFVVYPRRLPCETQRKPVARYISGNTAVHYCTIASTPGTHSVPWVLQKSKPGTNPFRLSPRVTTMRALTNDLNLVILAGSKEAADGLRTAVLYFKATLSRETVVRVVLNIHCNTWGFLLLTKSICDHCLKILQHLSSSTETCEVVLPLNARSPDSPYVCL